MPSASTYASAIQRLEEGGTTGRGDIEREIAAALNSLITKTQEASTIVGDLEKSPIADPTRWVSTARGQIDQSVSGMLDTLIDYGQRTGMRGGSPGVNAIIESTIKSLTPLAGQLTREAMGTGKELGLKRASLAESLGVREADLSTKKADLLTGLGRNIATEVAGVHKQQAADETSIEREKEKARYAMAIAGMLKPDSAKDVLSGYGVDPNMSSIYHSGETYNSRTGKWEKTTTGGAGGGGTTGGTSAFNPADALKTYNQAQNLYTSYNDPWRPGGRNTQGMGFAQDVMSQLQRSLRI